MSPGEPEVTNFASKAAIEDTNQTALHGTFVTGLETDLHLHFKLNRNKISHARSLMHMPHAKSYL